MKKLKLKDKYKGLIVTRTDIRVGKITFDANTVKPEDYQNFYDLGFTELFEEDRSVNEITKDLITEDPSYKDNMVKPKKIWYNNGKTNRRYYKDEQPLGWYKGKLPKDKKGE